MANNVWESGLTLLSSVPKLRPSNGVTQSSVLTTVLSPLDSLTNKVDKLNAVRNNSNQVSSNNKITAASEILSNCSMKITAEIRSNTPVPVSESDNTFSSNAIVR